METTEIDETSDAPVEPTFRSKLQRQAWAMFTSEDEPSMSEVARRLKCSTGSVGRWLKNWREELDDPDLFRGPKSIERARRTEAARAQMEFRWTELRADEAARAGLTASRIRSRLLELLPNVASRYVDRGPSGNGPPTIVEGPSAREIKWLVEAMVKLYQTAELLDDRPTRFSRIESDVRAAAVVGAAPGSGILSALEGKIVDGEIVDADDDVILEVAESVVAAIEAGGSEEETDTQAAEVLHLA